MDCMKLLWKRRVIKLCERFPMAYRIAWQVIAHRVLERCQHIGAFGRHRFDGRSRQGRNPLLGHPGGILAIGAEFTVCLWCSDVRWPLKNEANLELRTKRDIKAKETRQNESFGKSWKRLKGEVRVNVTSSTATTTDYSTTSINCHYYDDHYYLVARCSHAATFGGKVLLLLG